MNKNSFVALLVGGVIMIIWSVSASDSLSSDVSRFFTGSPTDKAIWLLVSGIVAAVVGLFGIFQGRGCRPHPLIISRTVKIIQV